MTKRNASHPRFPVLLAVACSALLSAASHTVPAAPNSHSLAVFNATFDPTCRSFTVTSSKHLASVLLLFNGGGWERFQGRGRTSGTFAGTGDNANAIIVTAYVKSGSFTQHVGDIPGAVGSDFDCFR